MSEKAIWILDRYKNGFVTDSQLLRYLELGAITQEEYDTIYATKHPMDAADQSESDGNIINDDGTVVKPGSESVAEKEDANSIP